MSPEATRKQHLPYPGGGVTFRVERTKCLLLLLRKNLCLEYGGAFNHRTQHAAFPFVCVQNPIWPQLVIGDIRV